MIKFENTKVTGWEAAIRGMRNPMNSWGKIDSFCCDIDIEDCPHSLRGTTPAIECNNGNFGYCIGENDIKLMRSLAKAGTDHAKFARMIVVTVDITAPLYWWKEFDTYKVGTVANSCSTMHKIMERDFTEDDFSLEYIIPFDNGWIEKTLANLNDIRDTYINFDEYSKEEGLLIEGITKKDVWYVLIQALPSSYNQRRTVQISYQNAWHMRSGRYDHKLDEWHLFCDWVDALPYFKEIYLDGKKEKDIRSKWERKIGGGGFNEWVELRCSNCRGVLRQDEDYKKYKYCPFCGAKMED